MDSFLFVIVVKLFRDKTGAGGTPDNKQIIIKTVNCIIGVISLLMQVQLASENDKDQWDLFVDRECGSFFLYYDWKFYYEYNNRNRYIPLLIRDETDSILGIFPVVEQYGPFYPSLYSLPKGASDGFLLKRDLSAPEKDHAVESFLGYIGEKYYHKAEYCFIRHQLPVSDDPVHRSPVLREHGYHLLDNSSTKLPCTHILSLEQPFSEKIWAGSWSKKLRKRIRHTQKSDVRIISDDDLTYKDDFITMQIRTAKKFKSEIKKEVLDEVFRKFQKKMKLFMLVRNSTPLAGALCYYTPSMAYLAMAPYLPAAENYLTNTLPICASIRYACDQGYRYYEMGVTSTETLAFHKEKFCARKIPLMMYYKEFSFFRKSTNKIARSLIRNGKKISDLFGNNNEY
jgi:hypothetical protein